MLVKKTGLANPDVVDRELPPRRELEEELRSLETLPEAERNKVLYEWNATSVPFPSHLCFHELFEAQARNNPQAIALIDAQGQLTYEQLNEHANRLAQCLREQGVGPDIRVAICLQRGRDMIIAVLGVLKAGGCYVPLDPVYPQERLRFMLGDSSPLLVLTHDRFRNLISGLDGNLPVVVLDDPSPQWRNHTTVNPVGAAVGLTPGHLAYVIYTSGSTGTPKGVTVEHRGLCNLAIALGRALVIRTRSRVLQFASSSFDACVYEIVTTLGAGGTLCIPSPTDLLAGECLEEVVQRYGITHATLPSAVLAGLPEEADLKTVKTLVLAGEALNESLARRWSCGRTLINAYGPTEATVCATFYVYDPGRAGAPPIGAPIENVRIYILGPQREPLPIGAAGEIYIGGIGVARGYLNRPELTAQRFVPDPFAGDPSARMYRTGDLGQWLSDGNIEFLGRNDFQIKIRGFRVELGEIEARLIAHPGVREATVIAREDTPGDRRIVAYYTVRDNFSADLDSQTLRLHLEGGLPQHMIPAAFVQLPAIPLTVNGKVNREELPAPDSHAFQSHGDETPEGETEEQLVKIWIDMLRVPSIGRHDSFFVLGGDSLLAARMITRVRTVFGVRVALFSFIQTPTIEYLARLLSGESITHMATIHPGSSSVVPLVWVAPEPWQPQLTSYLDGDQPVYSFVLSPEELASCAPEYHLEDMAARLVEKIRANLPGPAYVLAGFCQTSLLAYECAQQLRQLGCEIPLLIMGDAILPGYERSLTFLERSQRRLEREWFYLSAFRKAEPGEWRKLMQQRLGGLRALRARRAWRRSHEGDDKSKRRAEELYEALIVSYLSYHPSRFPGRVLYLQSGDRPQSELWNAAASWQSHIEQLETFEAPGGHTDLFREPNAGATARRIQQALDTLLPPPGRVSELAHSTHG